MQGTGLLWVNNTDSDVFRMGKTGPFTTWWRVVGFGAGFHRALDVCLDVAPCGLQKIPLEHDRSRVLASVPGTDEAIEAVLWRRFLKLRGSTRRRQRPPTMAFQGDPQFTPIEPTTVQRAVNTDKDVFKFGERATCVIRVWFVGKSATGPWEVTSSRCRRIYKIPVSSPAHHVTYVTIEEDDDDDWVVFAAAAGYTGMMVAWGCMVWGSGWYHPPYYGYGGSIHTAIRTSWPTEGTLLTCNIRGRAPTGAARPIMVPTAAPGRALATTPPGTYARGASSIWSLRARGAAKRFPRRATYAQTRQDRTCMEAGVDVGPRAAMIGPKQSLHEQTNWATTALLELTGECGNSTWLQWWYVAVGDGGNVYAGKDGNAYRQQDGTWQKYDNGNWSNTDRQPSGERPQPTTGSATGRATWRHGSQHGRSIEPHSPPDARARSGPRTTGITGAGGSATPRSTGGYRGRRRASRGGGDGADSSTNSRLCSQP